MLLREIEADPTLKREKFRGGSVWCRFSKSQITDLVNTCIYRGNFVSRITDFPSFPVV